MRVFIVFTLFTSPILSQIKPITAESTFKNIDNSFKIKYKVRDARNVNWDGQIIAYSVYVNKKFVHPYDWDGGRLTGCRNPYTDLKDTYTISVLGKNNNSAGWIISTRDWCGRGGGWKNVIIFPLVDGSSYKEYEFISSSIPSYSDLAVSDLSWDNAFIIDKNDSISILYKMHTWDASVNASYLVQKIDVIPYDGFTNMGKVIKGDILNDIIAAVKNGKRVAFSETFSAGLKDLNIKVMQYWTSYEKVESKLSNIL